MLHKMFLMLFIPFPRTPSYAVVQSQYTKVTRSPKTFPIVRRTVLLTSPKKRQKGEEEKTPVLDSLLCRQKLHPNAKPPFFLASASNKTPGMPRNQPPIRTLARKEEGGKKLEKFQKNSELSSKHKRSIHSADLGLSDRDLAHSPRVSAHLPWSSAIIPRSLFVLVGLPDQPPAAPAL